MTALSIPNRSIAWRIIEPIILGSVANMVINYIFNPQNPTTNTQEFVVAILLSAIMTELNRWVDQLLNRKYEWALFPEKRFLYHLVSLFIIAMIGLNVVGNIYMWIMFEWFYPLEDLLVINGVTFIVALLLTTFRWTRFFFLKWKALEVDQRKHDVNPDTSRISQEVQSHIQVSKGKRQVKLNVADILAAQTTSGVVKVFLEQNDFYIYNGTLHDLTKIFPEHLFFPVSRSVLINRSVIQGFATASYGKLNLIIVPNSIGDSNLTVSRPKAAAFRKWFNSNSHQI